MKKLFYLLTVFMFLVSSTGFSQDSGSGTIKGTVFDKTTGSPIDGAGISLYSNTDSTNVVTGANTDASGNFIIENVPYGEYYASVNLIGYSTAVVKGITVSADKPSVNLAKIELKPGETVTEEILVEEEKSDVQFTAEKKIFNVGKDLTLKGGTAIDALRNVPSVNVDQDGNVSIRGSEGVKITIDGKPFGLDGPNRTNILRSISADNIESIEIISNPSAKYEAEGISGIINIVTKQNDGFGYNGTLTVSTTTGDKYNGSFSGNLKKGDLNLFVDYSHNIWTSNFSFESSRQVFFPTDNPFYDLDAKSRFRSESDYVRGGLDYTIDKFNSFTLSGSYNNRRTKNTGNQNNLEYDASHNLSSQFLTNINANNTGYNLDLAFNYYLKFQNPKQSLTSEVTVSQYEDDQNGNTVVTDIYPTVQPDPYDYNEFQDNFTQEINAKIDYVHPIGDNSKIETGYQGEFIIDENDYNYDTLNYTTGQYILDANRSNQFNFDRQVNGFYALLSSGIGENFTYQLGLRVENTNRTGELVTTSQSYDKNYFDVFPSASLSQKLGKEEELQFSYSRRISRPRAGMLNPFPSFNSGNRNVFSGNPDLEAEYINSFELSFVKFFSGTSIVPSIYYRRADNNISRTRTFIDSVTTLTTFNNYNTTDTYGAELIFNSRPTSWLSLNGSIGYNKVKINADNIEAGLSNENSSANGRLSSSIRIPDWFNLQLVYYYSGQFAAAQGIVEPFQFFNAAISKDFWDGAATLSFRVSDIFNTQEFDIDLNDPNYTEALVFKRDSREANLSFTFRFGEQDKNQKRRPRVPQGDDGGNIGF